MLRKYYTRLDYTENIYRYLHARLSYLELPAYSVRRCELNWIETFLSYWMSFSSDLIWKPKNIEEGNERDSNANSQENGNKWIKLFSKAVTQKNGIE